MDTQKIDSYIHYIATLSPELAQQTQERINVFLKEYEEVDWSQEDKKFDYNTYGVINLILAGEENNFKEKYNLVSIAIKAFQVGFKRHQDFLCYIHLAVINIVFNYNQLLAEEQRKYIFDTLLNKHQQSFNFSKGIIYLPPRFQGDKYPTITASLVEAKSGEEQAFIMSLFLGLILLKIIYNFNVLQRIISIYDVSPKWSFLVPQIAISLFLYDSSYSHELLEKAKELYPESSTVFQSIFLADRESYGIVSEKTQQALALGKKCAEKYGNSQEWLWTTLPIDSPFTYVLFDHNIILSIEPSLNSLVTNTLLATGDWFEDEITLWRERITAGMVIIDVGANIGVYTFSAADRVGSTGKVIAIEPFSGCVTCLEETCRVNNYSWVNIYSAAASNFMGKAELDVKKYHEFNEVIIHENPEEISQNSISCITLDSLIEKEELTQVDWLKLDAEGHELQVLEGALQLIQKFRPKIIYENRAGDSLSSPEIMNFLNNLGYEFYYYHPYLNDLISIDTSQQLSLLNLIAIPINVSGQSFSLPSISEIIANNQLSEYLENFYQKNEQEPDNILIAGYLGVLLILSEDYLSAESLWLSVLTETNDQDCTTEKLLSVLSKCASDLLDNNQGYFASLIYEQIIEIDQENYLAYYNLGTILIRENQVDSGIFCLEKVIEIQPDFLPAYYNLAIVYETDKNWNQAIAYYQQALRINPDVDSYYHLGKCYLELDNLTSAKEAFLSCINGDSNYQSAYWELGETYLKLDLLELAWDAFAQGVKVNDQFVLAYLQTEKSRDNKNEESLLRIKFLEALISSESPEDIYCYFGYKLNQSQQYQGAFNCYQLALKLTENLNLKESIASLLDTINLSLENLQTNSDQLPKKPFIQGLYLTSKDWFKLNQNQNHSYQVIHHEHSVMLGYPQSLTTPIKFKLAGRSIVNPETFVVKLFAGKVWWDAKKGASAIITPQEEIIGDLSIHLPFPDPSDLDIHYYQSHPLFYEENTPKYHQVKGKVVVLPALTGQNYFHWMMDILPSLGLLQEAGMIEEISQIFIKDYHQFPFQQETLKLLNLDQNQLVNQNDYPYLQAEELIIPSLAGYLNIPTAWSCQFLRNTFLPHVTLKNDSPEKIYITRRHATRRKVLNETQLIRRLIPLGFTIVELESLSFLDQVSLMSQAKIIIAPHGAGLTNLVFCQPQTKVIEILSEHHEMPFFWLISHYCQLHYRYLKAEGLKGDYLRSLVYEKAEYEDIYLTEEMIMEIVKEAMTS